MRDERRGLRATVFVTGALMSPHFEPNDGAGRCVAERSLPLAGLLRRWWRRLIACSYQREESQPETQPSFEEVVTAELGLHVPELLTKDRADLESSEVLSPADPPVVAQERIAFEVAGGIHSGGERIVPITRRRLYPRQVATSYDDRLQMLRNALRTGCDAERALAIEGLKHHASRDELLTALQDPLEPLAAKAALAFAGTTNRELLTAAIKPHVSEGRLAAILALLPGLDS